MPVVIGTSISSLTSKATWRSIPNSAEMARTCAFHPESVSTSARRTSAANLMAFKRQRTRKNKAPAAQRPSRSLGTNIETAFAEDSVGAIWLAGALSAGIGDVVEAALLLTGAAG